ncbi:MAG: RecQ family ATP-dependent DNA helicase [Marinifilaceae bacterium]
MAEKPDIHQLLKRYWGYDEFRTPQEDIIRSVINGCDTLALMPTGGGKSITYQISGLALPGVCIVVTPLIALMKDQVEQLLVRDIPAIAIYTGMSRTAMQSAFNRLSGGKVKFLYISPERLESKNFRERLKHIPVSFIAIDEAHCISQWGYDFRPSYLKIAEVRDIFPNVPVLALTATATQEVIKDIQTKLAFHANANVFSKSFKRDNIVYVVREVEDKLEQVVHILQSVKGSAIVYVRTRQATEELAMYLRKQNINAGYYHAGLSSFQREAKQNDWKNDVTPVIVATNAFGMGIDKPNVRVVIHYDIPDSPEAYFQEAGRAGRDGKRAYAVLLYNAPAMKALKERAKKAFPEKAYIKDIYNKLCDFFQIEEGGGEGFAYEFDMDGFVKVFKLDYSRMLAALDILKVGGYLECTTDVNSASRISFIVSRETLNSIETDNPLLDRIIEFMLRTYAGLFTQYVFFDEQHVADLLDAERHDVYEALLTLARRRIVSYVPGNDRPYIVYHRPRLPINYIDISQQAYELRKRTFTAKLQGIFHYVQSTERCRQILLMDYFGQKGETPCGVCDVCIANKKDKNNGTVVTSQEILELLEKSPLNIISYVRSFPFEERKNVTNVIRELLEQNKIKYGSPFTIELLNE